MFTKEMIAPCGLDCSICVLAQRKENPCAGCRGPNDHKPAYCAYECPIITCERLRNKGYEYCDECPEYPCKDVMERETRYTNKYPRKESPLMNLREIRTLGMDAFLQKQAERFTCPSCGRPLSVHTSICQWCGHDTETKEA